MQFLKQALSVCLILLLVATAAFEDSPEPPGSHPAGGRPLKYQEPEYLTGSIYPREGGSRNPLFRFKRVARRSGAKLTVTREYTYPNGKPAARERVVYHGDLLVSYDLDEFQTGGSGSARIERPGADPSTGRIEFQFRKDSAPGVRAKTGAEALSKDTLVNDMAPGFLVEHWAELLRGGKAKCRIIVVPRRETVGFTFSKASDTTWRGQSVVIIKMEPTSIFVSALVQPLFFTVESAPPHRVLQYIGRTTPKIRADGKWEDLDALTTFDWSK